MIHNNKNYVIGSGSCQDCDLQSECIKTEGSFPCGPGNNSGGWRLESRRVPPFDNVEDARAYIAKGNGYPHIWCPLAGVECHKACPAYRMPWPVTDGRGGYVIEDGRCTSPMLVGS